MSRAIILTCKMYVCPWKQKLWQKCIIITKKKNEFISPDKLNSKNRKNTRKLVSSKRKLVVRLNWFGYDTKFYPC